MASENEMANMIINIAQQHSNSAVNNNAVTNINQTATITGLPTSSDPRYTVIYNGQNYKVPCPSYLGSLAIGDVVILYFYNGESQKK